MDNRWAQREGVREDDSTKLFSVVARRYVREVFPTKSYRTRRDNDKEIANLLRVFGHMPIDAIAPMHIPEYLDLRGKTAKVRANREKALFSHIFNKAREWGQQIGLFKDALRRLGDRLHYLNHANNRFWLDTRPNLRREMEERKRRFQDKEDVFPSVRERVQRGFASGVFGGIHVFTDSGDVPDDCPSAGAEAGRCGR